MLRYEHTKVVSPNSTSFFSLSLYIDLHNIMAASSFSVDVHYSISSIPNSILSKPPLGFSSFKRLLHTKRFTISCNSISASPINKLLIDGVNKKQLRRHYKMCSQIITRFHRTWMSRILVSPQAQSLFSLKPYEKRLHHHKHI